jgi:sterol desaturase/sphingolipid hydroxylase (fatty acid hydroxylase superfamily)
MCQYVYFVLVQQTQAESTRQALHRVVALWVRQHKVHRKLAPASSSGVSICTFVLVKQVNGE